MAKKDEIINNLDKWEWVGENSFQRIPDKPKIVKLEEEDKKAVEKALVEKIKKEYYLWKIKFIDKDIYKAIYSLSEDPEFEPIILERKPNPVADPEIERDKRKVGCYWLNLFSPENQEALKNANLEVETNTTTTLTPDEQRDSSEPPYGLLIGIGVVVGMLVLAVKYFFNF